MIGNVFIDANPNKPRVKETLAALSKLLGKKKIRAVFGSGAAKVFSKKGFKPGSETELFISLGGDGTFLNLARSVFPSEAPMLGINLGSLGFLSEVRLPGMAKAVEAVLDGKYHVDKRMVLECSVNGRDGFTALNEFVISGLTGRVINITVKVDGEYVNTYSADGLIVSTPTGSTAYSLSAGGPIVAPKVKGVIITPVCPHTLTNRPLLVSDESLIELAVVLKGAKAALVSDGQERHEINRDAKIIIKKAAGTVNMVIPAKNSYFKILREKLKWG